MSVCCVQGSPELRVQDIEIKQDMDFEDFLLRVKDEFERDVVFDYECGGALVRVERPRCVFTRVYMFCETLALPNRTRNAQNWSKVSPRGALNLPAARFLQTTRFDPLPVMHKIVHYVYDLVAPASLMRQLLICTEPKSSNLNPKPYQRL